ncbi:MAG: phosphoribosylformylglycinamidine synthase subunit PurL [Armatimonadetes bacterium]|nr:phosphoribosylformylglycinamidine synthase subunit PurL [Armatimonadota bacterium]
MAQKPALTARLFSVDQYADDEALAAALAGHGLGLTPFEARRVAELLGRNPTFTELHLFNAEWSEHCSYKSSKPTLKEFLPVTGPTVIQGPEEDAGILLLGDTGDGDRWGIVIAHESHNHPSQVLPTEGAATGIGGIVRDVDCMGADVIGVADPLRFGDPNGANRDRTRWIVGGVVDGIWQYGNALGVPNLGGDIVFDPCYDDNCLVNVVALGLVRESRIIHSRVPEEGRTEPYDLILVGKPTDDSGFGGAAFSSVVLDDDADEFNRGAVQVPDPFLKNVLLLHKANEAVRNAAFEAGVPVGMKDLGAAGIACCSSEICSSGGFGALIDLDRVPVALADMQAEVIACAETQERYIWAVPRTFSDTVLRIYNEDWSLPDIYEGARAAVIGEATVELRYTLLHHGEIVCDANIMDVTEGILYERAEEPRGWDEAEPELTFPANLGDVLLRLLASPNLASREPIYRFYDTEVQGAAVLRSGEADAGVIAPVPGTKFGVALSVDGNPRYGRISPYAGGATAVAEAIRNVSAVGATAVGMTDCLNFGNPEVPTAFWEFRDSVRGLSDAARSIEIKGQPGCPTPFVSGNVSLYNMSAAGNAIAPSPIVACIGVMDDYSRAVTVQLKAAGSALLLIGARRDELGGSDYYQVELDCHGAHVPSVDGAREMAQNEAVIDAISAGLVRASHDISGGGLLVSLAEMAMGGWCHGTLGASLDVSAVPFAGEPVPADRERVAKLFGETSGFVLEVDPANVAAVQALCAEKGAVCALVGQVTEAPTLTVTDGAAVLAQVAMSELVETWRGGLTAALA